MTRQREAATGATSDEHPEDDSVAVVARPPPMSLIVPRAARAPVAALACAFLSFGTAIGGLTGFTTAEGVSVTLLTSLFTFVSGALLTFTGFRRFAADGVEATLDPVRFGAALGALGLGMLAGLLIGVIGRCHVGVQSLLLGVNVVESQCMSGASLGPKQAVRGEVGLMSARRAPCIEAFKALNTAILSGNASPSALTREVSTVMVTCGIEGSVQAPP